MPIRISFAGQTFRTKLTRQSLVVLKLVLTKWAPSIPTLLDETDFRNSETKNIPPSRSHCSPTSGSLWCRYRIHLWSSEHVIRHQKRHQRFLVVGISNPPVVQRTCYPRVIQHQKLRHQQFLVVSEYCIHQASPSKHSLPEPFRNPGTSNPTNLRQPAIWPAQDVQKSVDSKGMGVTMDVP